MDETWVKITLNDNYSVSSVGRVRNDCNNHIFTPSQRSKTSPYLAIVLPIDGVYKTINVHTLVATAFLGVPASELVVNHKDGDKHNNRVDNLEWVTRSENDKHAFRMGLRQSTPNHVQAAIASRKRKVINMTLGTEHESIADAARAIGGHSTGVHRCVQGKRKTYYGMKFAYANIENGGAYGDKQGRL